MARTALISDIHGNGEALRVVLDDIGQLDSDRIICLGDLVEGGSENDWVCDTLRSRQIACVRGNHDEDHDVELTQTNEQWLASLPESIIEDQIVFTHESPANPPRKISSSYEAWRVFDETPYRRVFIGDSHIAAIYTDMGMTIGEAMRISFDYENPVCLNPAHRTVVCPGAVGYPRDGLAKPRFAIYDSADDSITFYASDAPVLDL